MTVLLNNNFDNNETDQCMFFHIFDFFGMETIQNLDKHFLNRAISLNNPDLFIKLATFSSLGNLYIYMDIENLPNLVFIFDFCENIL